MEFRFLSVRRVNPDSFRKTENLLIYYRTV